jgi:lipoprotein-anchoring transpeptidase ErfK/SrfK
MTLPSQSARSAGMTRSRVHHSRRRRRGPPRAVVAVGVVLAAGAVYGGWRLLGGGPDEAPAAQEPERVAADRPAPRESARQDPLADRALATRSPTPGESAAVEVRMGSQPVRVPTPPHEQQPRTTPSAEQPRPAGSAPTGSAGGSSADVQQLVRTAQEKLGQNDPIGARELLDRALRHPGTAESDRAPIRSRIATINDDVLFSPKLHRGEPRTSAYVVQRGDSLSRIASRQNLDIHLDLLVRVNRLASPDKIREGQTLKLVHGPFHAVVVKSAFRLDIYSGPPDSPEQWRYVRSFPVGLGEDDSTPTGTFVVDVKDKDPAWVNPRTGERFGRRDPENPIGDRWIGLEGVGDSLGHRGYGLHGTIEPESIGQMMSMGCVRLLEDDVHFLYGLLVERRSVVRIVP